MRLEEELKLVATEKEFDLVKLHFLNKKYHKSEFKRHPNGLSYLAYSGGEILIEIGFITENVMYFYDLRNIK